MKARSLRTRLLAWSSATSAFTLVLVIVQVDVTFRANIREQLQESLSFARRVAEGTRAGQIDARIAETLNMARCHRKGGQRGRPRLHAAALGHRGRDRAAAHGRHIVRRA